MNDNEMIEYLRKHGYKVEQNPMTTYRLEISFAGMRNSTETFEIDAPVGVDEDYLLTKLLEEEDIYDFLEVTEVEDLGDGEYEVTINFGGYIGVDSFYTVDADDEDEAADFAIEEAKDDISIDSFEDIGE